MQKQLDAIADEVNGRPRNTLGWHSSLEVYSHWLARPMLPPAIILQNPLNIGLDSNMPNLLDGIVILQNVFEQIE